MYIIVHIQKIIKKGEIKMKQTLFKNILFYLLMVKKNIYSCTAVDCLAHTLGCTPTRHTHTLETTGLDPNAVSKAS